jgi:hypothetical protein
MGNFKVATDPFKQKSGAVFSDNTEGLYGCKQIEIEKGEEGEAAAATTKPAKKHDGLGYPLDHNRRLGVACLLPHLGFHQAMNRIHPFSSRRYKVIGTR